MKIFLRFILVMWVFTSTPLIFDYAITIKDMSGAYGIVIINYILCAIWGFSYWSDITKC